MIRNPFRIGTIRSAYRKVMHSKGMKLDRFFYRHYEDTPRVVGLNKYMQEKVEDIRNLRNFACSLPVEAKHIEYEQLEDMRNYRQKQLARSVENIYEAIHMLASSAFDYKPAADILVSKIMMFEPYEDKNHLGILISNISSIILSAQNKQNETAATANKIELSDWQIDALKKRIKYIEHLREKTNGCATDNS